MSVHFLSFVFYFFNSPFLETMQRLFDLLVAERKLLCTVIFSISKEASKAFSLKNTISEVITDLVEYNLYNNGNDLKETTTCTLDLRQWGVCSVLVCQF